MKRQSLAAALTVAGALILAGCGEFIPPSPDEGQFVRRLQSAKDIYGEYEPLDLLLVTQNNTSKPKPLGLQDRGGYLVLHEITDNDQALWRPIPVDQDVVAQQVMPGETVDLRIAAGAGAVLTRPGTWVVSYRYYPEAGGRRRVAFATQDIFVRCAPQPVALPQGAPADVADAMKALALAPAHEYSSRFPAWTRVHYSEPMNRLLAMGPRVAPALLVNLNNYRLRPAVIQLLGDLRYAPAAPYLLALLQMNDSTQDRLVLSALATLTEHPRRLDFYSRWSEPEIKEEALRAYREWTAQNR
jgi:hypothetical protein